MVLPDRLRPQMRGVPRERPAERVEREEMYARRIAAIALALSIAGPALAACDGEDVRDVREGVEDVQQQVEEGAKEVEEGAKEVEEEIDQADTDGQDN
jgi:hypothetical protein